ncbi:MAG: VWA domain-containing protein [Saprospiraceae bacterium]|nr:VWA domain-containing protein [Saprospiraceae bacterium]
MFRFQHPDHLWLLAAVPILLLLLFGYRQWRRNVLTRLGETARLMPVFSELKFWLKGILFALALVFLSLAWANPQMGARKQTTTQKAADVFLAIDISQSMLCRDVAPSRLELTKIFAQKIVQALEGERIGLIFFAGNAFLAVPLSTDYSFVLQSIQSASPDLLTEQGTAIGSALELAEKSFESESGGGRAVVLITDGENHDEAALDTAKKSFDRGTVVLAVGAATAGGGPIPSSDWEGSQYKRDEKGEVVRTRLNEDLLRKIAQAGGGQALNISQSDRAVAAIERAVGRLEKRALEVRSLSELESWYQWFLFPALLFLSLETLVSFRKRQKIAE